MEFSIAGKNLQETQPKNLKAEEGAPKSASLTKEEGERVSALIAKLKNEYNEPKS